MSRLMMDSYSRFEGMDALEKNRKATGASELSAA